MASWIIISSNVESLNEAKYLYINRYPEIIGSNIKITLLNIVLSAIAGIGFVKANSNLNYESTILKVLSGVSFTLAAWQIFSLL